LSRYGAYDLLGYCYPIYDTLTDHVQEDWANLEKHITKAMGGETGQDIFRGKWVILGSFGIALLIVIPYIIMLDKIAFWLAWLSVALIQASLIMVGIACWYARKEVMEDNDESNDGSATYFFWGAIVAWLVALVWYVMIACFFKHLQTAIAIIETAADWFEDTKRILLIPFMYFLIGIILVSGWTGCMICVYSIGEIEVTSVKMQEKHVEWDKNTSYMALYMYFGILWIISFLMAANEFATITSTATWYFSRKDIPDDDGIPGDSEVGKGLWWTFRYHTGTLAFGSLIIAIIWLIRSIFEWVGNKVEKASGGNCAVKGLLCCIRCCLSCFDRFMRFIN
jgi:hypothetical protein